MDEIKPNLSRLESGVGMYFCRSNKNWSILRTLSLIKKNKKEGIPQGLPCSGVLANIAMMQFDLKMKEFASNSDSIYLRYADDIFIASPNETINKKLHQKCQDELERLSLPIANDKTEKFNFTKECSVHPKISYLGLECKGNEITVRMNGVNKFYQKTLQYIYSYVLTCKNRNIKPSKKKIRAIFSHSGKRNYYSYLRRASKVFDNDSKYKANGIKGVMKNHLSWIDRVFDEAINSKPSKENRVYKSDSVCDCPLKMDN